MKISTLIRRFLAPAYMSALLSLQYLSGDDSYAFNLDSNEHHNAPDISSILRHKAPSVVHSEDTFSKPDAYFYQIPDPQALKFIAADAPPNADLNSLIAAEGEIA